VLLLLLFQPTHATGDDTSTREFSYSVCRAATLNNNNDDNNNNNNNNDNDNFYGAITCTKRFNGAIQNSTIVTAPNAVNLGLQPKLILRQILTVKFPKVVLQHT